MKILFTEPESIVYDTGDKYVKDSDKWAMLFEAAVYYHGVFLGVMDRDWRLSYNYLYHHYRLSMYELLGNGKNARRSSINDMREFLKSRNIEFFEQPGWRWHRVSNSKPQEVPGVTFTFKPEKED